MLQSLKDLTPSEFGRFENFANFPLFNTNTKITALFTYFKRFYPNISDSDLSKEKMFSAIYPRETYNDAKIRKLISNFTLLYKKFLSFIAMKKIDEDYEKTVLLEELYSRGLHSTFERDYREISDNLKKKFIKDDAYYRNMSRIEILNSQYCHGNGRLDEFADSLQNSSNNDDLYFIFSKLHVFREMTIGQMSTGKNFNFKMEFLNEVVKYVEENISRIKREHPNIYIIYLSLMSEHKKKDSYTNELISYVKLNEQNFEKDKLNYYFHYIASYYWNRINEGKTVYYKNVFDIYKYMVRKGIVKTEKYINHRVLNNVVIAALAAHEYKWLKKFLAEYRNDIEPQYAEDAYNLSLAKLYSQKGEYKNAMKYLQEVEYMDPNYYLNSKNILLKSLYELDDLDQAEYIIDSLKHYVIRNKNLFPEQVLLTNNLVKYMGWLIRIKRLHPDDAVNMKASLDKEKSFIPNKEWFYEKLEV